MASDDSDDDSERDRVRMLIKRYRINFKDPSKIDEWPLAQKNNFQNIHKIRDQKFDSYCAAVNIHSSDEPWREQTKHRATWLAKRTCTLFSQQRNEAGWRTLEEHVLMRFAVEVACPKCRARIWRSEIEASIGQSDDLRGHLDERRKRRAPCSCSAKDRPRDLYNIGQIPLFDNRLQQKILHDPLVRSELPKKEPDRVCGLNATKNFEQLLSTQFSDASPCKAATTVGQVVRSCPFKDAVNPLLFPFLVLEAKSEKAKDGFDDIIAQIAFPILALLKLQIGLRDQLSSKHGAEPLNIFQLWDGSIMDENNALQLLLIVDYIFDWARDIYRPAVLRGLNSLANGKSYDEVSLTNDSDVGSILDWIQPPPSDVNQSDFNLSPRRPNMSLEHQDLLPLPIPNTQTGTMRSAYLVESTLVGLYITDFNVLLLVALCNTGDPRKLLNFMARWDELFLLTGEDLDDLEENWTGKPRQAEDERKSSQKSEFYVLIETTTFINQSWNLTRELTYMAVSKIGLEALIESAKYTVKQNSVLSIPTKARSCSGKVLVDAIKCLQSCSLSQVFSMATACTSLSLYQLPERRRTDHSPPTKAIGTGAVQRPQLPEIVNSFAKFARPERAHKKSKLRGRTFEELDEVVARNKHLIPLPANLTFLRRSGRRDRLSKEALHDAESCERCRISGHGILRLDLGSEETFSAYGMSVVTSLDLSKPKGNNHEVCIFVTDADSAIDYQTALPVVLEDLVQNGALHHTIRHPLPDNFSRQSGLLHEYDRLWNLPLPYRPVTREESTHFAEWLAELDGRELPVPDEGKEVGRDEDEDEKENTDVDCWDTLQLLLYFLDKFGTWELVNRELINELAVRKSRHEFMESWECVGKHTRRGLYKKISSEKRIENLKREKESGSGSRSGSRLMGPPLRARGD